MGSTVQEGIYHIVGIGMEKAPALTKRAPGLSAQKIIDEIHNVNGIAILAHPAWSLDRASEVVKLYGIDGCEIYNTTSGLPWNCRPYSGVFFDEIGENVTEATYKVQPTDTFVRVELKDKDGNCGWSGIYPVNKK